MISNQGFNSTPKASDFNNQTYFKNRKFLKKAIKKCITSESGKGKNRKKLSEVVKLTIAFFKKKILQN